MAGLTSQLFRGGLSALWFSGAARATSRWTAGKGAVLMLHRVQPEAHVELAPKAALSITPRYLERLICSFRAADLDIVSLDEALQRVAAPARTRRFVCFTFDDGYRDNLQHAAPLFQRHGAPFTVYATSSFHDRTFAPWWCAIEHVLRQERVLRWPTDAGERRIETADLASKARVFGELSGELFPRPVAEIRERLQRFLELHGMSFAELAHRELCDWQELRELRDRGAEIGCHTVSHASLLCEPAESLKRELAEARVRIESELGRPARHLAYPYGKRDHASEREFRAARELGFATAVTTRKGALFKHHAQHCEAWPRVEVTPSFERSTHYLQAILSGLPLWAWNRGRLVVTD